MFYGWGKKTRDWPMPDGQTVLCTFNFVSLMFIFKLATKKQWMIVGNDRSQDQTVSRSEIESRYGQHAPNIGVWDQFGLLIGIGAFIVLVLLISAF